MRGFFKKVTNARLVCLGSAEYYALTLACGHTQDNKAEVKRAKCKECEAKAAAEYKANVDKRMSELEAIKNGTWGRP